MEGVEGVVRKVDNSLLTDTGHRAMISKSKILDALGEKGLMLPRLVNEGLAANDRAKYYFTLLQIAREHADDPVREVGDVSRERLASGVEDSGYDFVVAESRKIDEDLYHISHAGIICEQIAECVNLRLSPVAAAGRPNTSGISGYERRLENLLENVIPHDAESISGSQIDELTSPHREKGDSLHLLVMDLHKELNRIQTDLSEETIDGASVYEIADDDRSLVGSFMRGLNRTSPLRFDHPGLATTATRSGDRLILQNDLGTTDAHVLVLHVAGLTATLTYTDVHLERLLFFQSLFERFEVRWDDARSRKDEAMEEGVYHLSLGVYEAPDRRRLEEYIEFLGSRLVFLIDWNKARKRLRNFVRNQDSIWLLKWAADHDLGHMAFLKVGGEQLIFEPWNWSPRGSSVTARNCATCSAPKMPSNTCDLPSEPAPRDCCKAGRSCSSAMRYGQSSSIISEAHRID